MLSLLALVVASGLCFPESAAARQPNDFYFGEQWYLSHVGAPEAWNYSLGMETVPIAIIDSGVDLDHPDLKDNIWRNVNEVAGDGIDNDRNGYIDDVHGWDFVNKDNDPNPDVEGDYVILGANHGTISAGLAAAKGDNGQGIVGMTWQVPIMVLRALDSNGVGDPLHVARAVDYAVANGAKVINLSFAGTSHSSMLDASLRRAYDRGVFVVAAAGNSPDNGVAINLDISPRYPVCFDRDSNVNYIYGVAATDQSDNKAEFSNYGASCVDVSAPGARVISTQVNISGHADFSEPYGGYYSGTSVAAPLVSGLVALMFSLDRSLTPRQVMNMLTETSFNINDLNPEYFGLLGRGRIAADKAVKKVLERDSVSKPIEPVVPTAVLTPEESSGRYVVATPGPGREPEVRLFTEDGLFVRGFNAFPESFQGGVSLAIGNFDGTHPSSIVTGALAGGGPHVRIFDVNTRPIGGFFAYDAAFTGGVEVAVGDLDGDGIDEIITGAGPGGGPHVRMFDKRGHPMGGFFAYEDSYRGGVDVAAGDLGGDGSTEIVVAPGEGKSEVRIFDAVGKHLYSLLPFGHSYARGMQVKIDDLNGDGSVELVIRGYNADGNITTSVHDGNGDYIGDGGSVPDLSASAVGIDVPQFNHRTVWGHIDGANVTLTATSTSPAMTFYAYETSFRGGVRAALIE